MMRRAVGGGAFTATPGTAGALARSGRRLTAGLLLAFVGLLALLSGYENAAANSAPTFDDGADTSREFDETIGDATVTTASDIGAAITATDTDTGDTLEYTLGGTDAAKFGIISTSGQIQTKVDETYSYETKTSYDVTVTVEDGNGGSATIDVMLNVVNQDEPPLRPAAPMVSGPASNSTTSLRVVMTAPDNSGRPPITRYKLRTHRDGFGWSNLPYNPSSAQNITGITSGKRYHVQFRVKNDEGEGPWSPTTFGYTKAHASGMPDISGTARVGRTLTAGTSGISDRNGKSKAENGDVGFAYTYQWVRVDGGTETDISGETASTYTLTMADLGKTIKVTASFTDNVGYAEGPLTSDAYPSSGTVALLELSFAENIVNVDEDAGSATLTVGLAPAGTEMVTVDYATRDSGAEAGEDYTATSGTLTFAPGETSKTITILITDDNIYEDLESFFLDLSDPSGTALPAIPTRAVEIASDDSEPTASMDDVTVDEGAGTMTLTLHLSHPSGEDITYSTIDNQVTGTATARDDYDDFLTGPGGIARITVPAEELSQTFDITIVDDNFEETDETIVITWEKLTAHTVTPERLNFTGTIEDNDEGAGAARGKPRITGTAEVGGTLRANTSGISDQNGKTKAENGHTGFAYTYQWIRVDGSNETNIAGGTGNTYTLVAADEGKEIRVRVSFTDDAGNPETVTSDVYSEVVILPAPRLPLVDDPNAIWMATLTVAKLGLNKNGYKGSQGGLTDTAFTYLGNDTPLSEGGSYQEVGTLYTIDELSYHTVTGQLVLSLDGQFVGGDAANIFVDVGGMRRSFSGASYSSGPHTYTFTDFPNPPWLAGNEEPVKIVVLAETNGPEDLIATSAKSGDGFYVTLTWAVPTSGGTVTDYRVEHQPDPALQWRTLEPSLSDTTYTDSGLARGTVRYYRVAGLRSVGASYSEIVRVQAPSETAEIPLKVNYVDVKPAEGSHTALEVAWNRPRTPISRAPAMGYHVQYAQHDGAVPVQRDGEDWAMVTFPRWMERLPWQTWSGAVEAIEFEESTERSPHLKTVVTGLAPGTNYRVRVRGCTEAGCGEWSYPRRWTTSGATSNATEAEPLTATLEDFPTNHDGSSAFTFRIAFSADVEITPEDMRDHALTVTGGTVTNATRVDGRSDLWELTVEPAGTGAVSVLVPLDRACTETGALCTADGQALSTAPGHSVPGPAPVPQGQQALAPLAAGFVSVPAEHDGETEFWLELSFGAAVAQGSKPNIRALLGVTGGSVTRLRRKDERLDHWRIRVEPSSHEAVTVTLSPSPPCGATGAVCTEDGRTFTTALATQIQGPPGLAVADAEVQEGPNATLAFAVTLSRAPSGTVTVDYATSDGTATAGTDYTATSGTLSFAAGETEKSVSVPVLDDGHDEGSETLTLTLANPSGAYLADGSATGTINNTDPMPLAWMVRFGRTVSSQVVDALGERLDSGGASHVSVGGISLIGEPGKLPVENDDPFALPKWTTRSGLETDGDDITAHDLLLGSAFHLSSGSGQGEGPAYTAWGRVARSGFEAEVDDVTMNGDVTSALIGFDAEWERLLAGVMVSQSRGEGAYRLDSEESDGTVESSLTGIYPYAQLELNRQVSAWALAGAGSGGLTLHQNGKKAMPTDIGLRMGAIGVKGQVLDGTGASGLAVNVKSDAMWVGTKSERTADMVGTQGDVTRLRLTLEGERAFDMGGGATLTPSAEVGLRHDAGDAETGTGLEVGTGVSYAAGPLTVEGQVRMLVVHEDSGYEEWGASGAIRITPSASGRGLMVTIAPEWGRTGSATDRLWSAPDTRALGTNSVFEGNARLAVEAGYGIGVGHGRGVLTPYAGLTLGDGGTRTMRTGMRWQVAPDAVFGLEGTQRADSAGEGDNEVRLRAALRF